jgi:hypothetical protein
VAWSADRDEILFVEDASTLGAVDEFVYILSLALAIGFLSVETSERWARFATRPFFQETLH